MIQMEHFQILPECKVECRILEIRKVLSILILQQNMLVSTLERLSKDWLTLVMFEAKVFELHLMTLEMRLVSLFGIINLFFISFPCSKFCCFSSHDKRLKLQGSITQQRIVKVYLSDNAGQCTKIAVRM